MGVASILGNIRHKLAENCCVILQIGVVTGVLLMKSRGYDPHSVGADAVTVAGWPKGTNMESVTAINAYAEYQGAAKLLAKRFGPRPGMLDLKARSRDDYTQELRLKAIEVADRFQRIRGFCLPAERRYTHKALWNRARSWRRDQGRHQIFEQTYDAHSAKALGVYQIEEQLEARETLRMLADVLSQEDQEILTRLALVNGAISHAWDPNLDGTLRNFQRKVAKMRRSAKRAVMRKNTVGVSRVWG